MSYLFTLLCACLAIVPVAEQTVTEQTVAEQPDTLVICPAEFQAEMQTWIRYRSSQKHVVQMIVPANNPYGIKQQVQKVAEGGKLKSVVLIGDSRDRNTPPGNLVPTDYIKAKVNVNFGSEPEIATDNTFADLDDDGIPDVAIGRIPVNSKQELREQIQKIIRYESESSDLSWQRRVNFVAGVGGFGQLVDKLIEQTTKQIITDLIPPAYETSMTYGSWTSPYCPDPRRFSQSAIDRFNEGCMFWVYIGHGNRKRLDKIYLPDQNHGILDVNTVKHLKCEKGNPVAIFLACYTGATDDDSDGMAEAMLKQPGGPIAIIAGSRVTMPYAMSVQSLEMINEYFRGKANTIGELILLAKTRSMEPVKKSDQYRSMIEGMGKAFSPKSNLLKEERAEHLHLMHLIGDPLLRLKRPSPLKITTSSSATAGETITVKGSVASPGELSIDVSYVRDRFRFRPPRRKEYDSSNESFNRYQETYEQARRQDCVRVKKVVNQGPFSIEIQLPKDISGKCTVTAALSSRNGTELGAIPLDVSPAQRQAKKEPVEKTDSK